MKKYEFSPEQSSEKLMNFIRVHMAHPNGRPKTHLRPPKGAKCIRDMGDDEDQIEQEKEYVAELFDELQKSEKFEVLAHYFDLMFMDGVFK